MLFERDRWPFLAVFVMTSHFTESKLTLLTIMFNIFTNVEVMDETMVMASSETNSLVK